MLLDRQDWSEPDGMRQMSDLRLVHYFHSSCSQHEDHMLPLSVAGCRCGQEGSQEAADRSEGEACNPFSASACS